MKFLEIVNTKTPKPELNCSGIYIIYNDVNGKFYIGSAKHLRRRFVAHKSSLIRGKSNSKGLLSAVKKYGIENFTIEVVERVQHIENLINREQYYIDFLKPQYNMRKIADSNLGCTWTEEHKKKIGDASRGRKASDETRKKIGDAQRGVKKNPAGVKKRADARRGIPINVGAVRSVEYRNKIRETIKRKYPKGSVCGQAKPVYQYDKDYNFIAEYCSITKASMDLGISQSTISNYLNGKRISRGAGFIWTRHKI